MESWFHRLCHAGCEELHPRTGLQSFIGFAGALGGESGMSAFGGPDNNSGRPENDRSVGMIVVERYYQRLTLWNAPQTLLWQRAEDESEPQADGTA